MTLETLGVEGWVPIDGISAHPKVDEATGELMFFNYSKHAPYLHYGVVDADNRLKVLQPIPIFPARACRTTWPSPRTTRSSTTCRCSGTPSC